MQPSTVISLHPTGSTGDQVLRASGIEVASVHNHLLDNQPSLVFMHFWAYGDALSLAKGLKAALGRVGS